MAFEHLCMGCMSDKGEDPVCLYCGWEETAESQSSYHIPPRTILLNRYLIGKVLDEKKFDITYLGFDLNSNRKVVVKEYLPRDIAARLAPELAIQLKDLEFLDDFNFGLETFLEEGEILQSIEPHIGLPKVYHSFPANSTAYRVREFVEGVSLKGMVQKKGGQISYNTLMEILTPVMVGLEQIHQNGLLHYGIHPESILVTEKLSGVLISFNWSKYIFSQHRRNPLTNLHPGYSPLELYIANEMPGPWSDVYSLAATIYGAFTGKVPPNSVSRLEDDTLQRPSKLGKKISIEAETALMRALSIRPLTRFHSISDFEEALLEKDSFKKIQAYASALDAFTKIICPTCQTPNEVLIIDLEKGICTCMNCRQPLLSGHFPDGSSAGEPEKSGHAVPPEISFDIPEEEADGKKIASSDGEDFTVVQCRECGTENEILMIDLDTGIRCLNCGADLSQGSELPEPLTPERLPENDIAEDSPSPPPPAAGEVPEAFPGTPEVDTTEALRESEQEELAESETEPVDGADDFTRVSEEIAESEQTTGVSPGEIPEIQFEEWSDQAEGTSESFPITDSQPQKFSRIPLWIWPAAAVFLIAAAVAVYWFQRAPDRQAIFARHREAGDVSFRQGAYREALVSYHTALAFKPEDRYVQAQIRRSDSLLEETRRAEVFQKEWDFYQEQLKAADSLFAMGEFQAARSIYKTLLNKLPQDSLILEKLEEIEQQQQKAALLPESRSGRNLPGRGMSMQVRPADDLQSHIDRASSNSIIRFASGIFKLTRPLVINKALTLEGAGQTRTLIVADFDQPMLNIQSPESFSVKGIGFEYEGESPTNILSVQNARVDIKNCTFTGAFYAREDQLLGNAILLQGNSSGSIQNSRIYHNHNGIRVSGRSKPQIINNDLFNNRVGVLITEHARPLLRDNRIKENLLNGIVLNDSPQANIERNTISANEANGIVFSTQNFSGTVRNNEILSNKEAGILLTGSSQPTLEGNLIQLNGQGGIQYRDKARGIARENDIKENASWGIIITNAAQPAVKNNKIRANQGDGIEVTAEAIPTIDDNEVTKNSGDGISLIMSKSGGFVRNNLCTGNRGYGISILGSIKPPMLNNKTHGNYEGSIYQGED